MNVTMSQERKELERLIIENPGICDQLLEVVREIIAHRAEQGGTSK